MWEDLPVVGEGPGMNPLTASGVLPITSIHDRGSTTSASTGEEGRGASRDVSPLRCELVSAISLVNHDVVGMECPMTEGVTMDAIHGQLIADAVHPNHLQDGRSRNLGELPKALFVIRLPSQISFHQPHSAQTAS